MRNKTKSTTAKVVGAMLAVLGAAWPVWAETTVEVGSSYVDKGAQATDSYDGDITSRIVTANAVNTGVVGTYTVTYAVSDSSGNPASPATRTVKVVDTTKPVITLVGNASISVTSGASFTDPGVTAKDNYDGDITSKVVRSGEVKTSVPGAYPLSYNVVDAAGNAAATVVRTVTVTAVQDTTKPVITLLGSATIKVRWGKTYTDAGATATDNVDGDITSKIVKSGSVNVWFPGTYKLTFNVNDAAGNQAVPVVRTVQVTLSGKDGEESNTLAITAPLHGSTHYTSATAASSTLTFTASAPLDTESVEFALDGTVVGSSTTAPYVVAADINPSALGWGEHHVTATAKVTSSAETLSAESTFTLSPVSADGDTNNNGIADNPFVTLALDGDAWTHTVVVPETNGSRVTGMVRFEGLDEANDTETPLAVVLGSDSDTTVNVTIPRALLTAGETGILVVQFAKDLNTLFGSTEAANLLPEPEGQSFVKGGVYLEVTVLSSSDGGVTFDEVSEARIAQHPVHVEMQGLQPTTDSTVSLFKHPMFMGSDSVTGLTMTSEEGSWSVSGVQELSVESDWMNASLTSLSVMAPYETVKADETETQQPVSAGCVGSVMSGMPLTHASGDLLLLGLVLSVLVLVGSKNLLKRA